MPFINSGGTGGAGHPPGFEISYTQITSPVNITDTLEATATALISPGAVTFDGLPVIVTFFCPSVLSDSNAAGDIVIPSLFEGATQIARFGIARTLLTAAPNESPLCCSFRFTPTLGSHTYKLTAFVSSTVGTPQLACGNFGTATFAPAYLRFTKV